MKTHYRFDGPAGAPVVTLTHPLGATLALWDAQVPALMAHYRVFRHDVRDFTNALLGFLREPE